ncbi:hypothetical protein J32TS6_13440 [Virgibacillus pantothenticus]|uniref:Membrane protein n=1 Tax=Virgibacillus pantothenticus TaxID=1473 RepID=A0A0L0QLD0_VIRPA|nr:MULTISPECIES: DUF3147 family protein [Virgibacillus]API93106.1 hypothetical protein BKP57_15590 [Virgibacillus sp. 6R]KNE19402.1 membrane protein [Virgibacillus pantothenticus]MBS7428859.1 DUF3147 family protein [Virgibacillus sp. 19R1-5]MBU8568434.1 DUF3147 family protein [Virgibacillus pantothenticus]MBU8602432.1 DUF3147 family protein [Virgibacillus pantothenticus]
MYLFIKIVSSAVIIGIVTELARRFPVYGGVIAALPLISILSIIWLTVQGESAKTINEFTVGVIAGLPATIVMLLIIYFAFKHSFHLSVAFLFGIIGWGFFLIIQKYITGLFFS